MRRVIIFGNNGQDGYYLSQIFSERGYDVIGVSRTGHGITGDVGCAEFVETLVKEHCPERIFHLAANSTTRHSALIENHKTISTGTLNILESVYRNCPNCKVFLTGSGVQFVNNEKPVHENDQFFAASAYSAERIYSVYLGRYFRQLGLKVYVGYLFHHESPLRKHCHISQKVVQAVRRIASGSAEKIELGDISVRKEWAFAGDIALGIAMLTDQEGVFESVIGTGKAYTIENWLEVCFSLIKMNWQDFVILTPGFTPEYNCLVSNPETMNSLGWQPKIDLRELARMMLDSVVSLNT